LRYDITYPRNCMAQSNAARTLISFCVNLSSSIVLVAKLLMQLVCCVRCTFVFVFPSCHRFFLGCWRRPVSWKTEEFASQRCEEHLRRTLLLVWCKDRDRNGSEDGALTADTCFRCGEHGESRMVRPLCTNRMLLLK
jgi:hypothetical protein